MFRRKRRHEAGDGKEGGQHPGGEGVGASGSSTAAITGLLVQVGQGNQNAVNELLPRVYGQLRALAGQYFQDERTDHTLQPTALVHEAYLRLVGSEYQGWESRRHFYRVAAVAMRRILVDHARRHRAAKRGEGKKLPLMEAAHAGGELDLDLIALDEALSRLAALNLRKARVVELRFFAGLTTEETARALDVTTRTVERDWRLARAWLFREMGGGKSSDC
jgi:RNA polymerase sigma factor (TIGR02999 family)